MNDNSLARWTGIAGIATVVLTMIALGMFGTASPPKESDPAQSVATFFADHQRLIFVAGYIAALSIGCNLAFYIGLRDLFRRRAPEVDTLATVGLIGGVAFITILFVAFAILLQLAYRKGAGDAGLQQSLFDLQALITTMTGVPTALSAAAISIAVLQSGLFPRWIGWYGFAVAAIHLVSVGSLARDGFFTPGVVGGIVAPLMFEAWVLAFSVLLLTQASTTTGRTSGT